MTTGPIHLGKPDIAQKVTDSLHFMDGEAYKIVYKTQEILWVSMKRHKSYIGR